jgi:thiol peroxidase
MVTLKGKKVTLKGTLPKEGQKAPDCELVENDLTAVKLSKYKGKAWILLSVPSLDTPVCSKEAHRFVQEVEKYKEWLTLICVSMDLPFAQARWCAAEGSKNVVTLSDYKKHEFGEKYGVYIEEVGLLARVVFLIDSNMQIISTQIVDEISHEPDYSKVLTQIPQLMARPAK